MIEVHDKLQIWICKILLELGDNAQLYWQFGSILLIFFVILYAWILYKNDNQSTHSNCHFNLIKILKHEYLFLIALFVALLIIRLPGLSRGYLNPDESEWIASCNTLYLDPSFWWSANWSTTRPFTVFLLMPFKILGLVLNHSIAQFAVLIYSFITIIIFYKILRTFFDQKYAQFLILPIWSSVCLFSLWDYIAFNSEYACLFYISIILLIALHLSKTEESKQKVNGLWLFIVGILIGILPHTKDQSLPIAILLSLWFIFFFRKNKVWIYLFGGWLTLNAIIVSHLLIVGDLDAFVLSITNRFQHAEEGLTIADQVYPYGKFVESFNRIFSVLDSRPYLFISTIPFLLLLPRVIKKIRKQITVEVQIYLLILLLLAGSWATVYVPDGFFPHYNIFVVFPALLIASFSIGIFLKTNKQPGFVIISICFLLILLPSAYSVKNGNLAFHNVEARLSYANNLHPISKAILQYAKKGETMAVWGWNNYLFVETGLAYGTRIPFPIYIKENYPSKEYDLQSYRHDLVSRKPRFFVDIYNDFSKEQSEYTEIQKVIRESYTKMTNIKDYSVYILK